MIQQPMQQTLQLTKQQAMQLVDNIRSEPDYVKKANLLFRHAEKHWMEPIMHLAGILPLIGILGTAAGVSLGIMPIGDLEDTAESIGTIAMWFFAAMLACTPIYVATGWRKPLSWKKPLALYAFMYTALHMAGFYFAYDTTLNAFILQSLTDVTMLSGTLALLIMVPLAITSNRWSMKRLGKRWKKLHKLTYLVAIIAAAHLLAVGDGLALLYIGLLVMRIPKIRKGIIKFRKSNKFNPRALLPVRA